MNHRRVGHFHVVSSLNFCQDCVALEIQRKRRRAEGGGGGEREREREREGEGMKFVMPRSPTSCRLDQIPSVAGHR